MKFFVKIPENFSKTHKELKNRLQQLLSPKAKLVGIKSYLEKSA